MQWTSFYDIRKRNTPISKTRPLFCQNFRDRLAYTAIRHLDMQESCHSRGNICHIDSRIGMAVMNAPSHEQQGDMGVIGVPGAVGGSGLPVCLKPSGIEDQLDWAATPGIMASGSRQLN